MRSGKFTSGIGSCLMAGAAVLFFSLIFPEPAKAELFVFDGEYDWEEEQDQQEYGDSSWGYETGGNGPGADNTGSEMETDSIILDGPSVNQVTLQEQYHEDFKIYEESLEDQFFFYASVGNGGITNKPVTLDIPHNITYTIEKDGLPWEYVPGQTISEYGTYVIRLTGVEDTTTALSEQREYRAVFRFRIQSKPPADEEEEGSGSLSGGGWTDFAYDGSRIGGEEVSTAVSGLAGSLAGSEASGEEETVPGTEAAQEEESLGQEEQESSADGETGETESGGEEANAEAGSGEEGSQGGRPAGSTAANTGFLPRIQEYDAGARQYQVTFPGGSGLSANVPEGYVGAGPVTITAASADAEGAVLYRDDEPVEYVWGDSLTEPGHYRAELKEGAWSCTIATYVRDMAYYPAPAGTEFSSVLLEGEPLELRSRQWVSLEQDGQYQFSLKGQSGETIDSVLIRDTAAPEISVAVRGGTASIQYLSEDIEDIRLERNGELVEGFSGYSVNRPGNYQLTVADHAGNEASSQFTLTYQVNRYGVIAVVLVILLVIGGVVFVIHTKRTVKIR